MYLLLVFVFGPTWILTEECDFRMIFSSIVGVKCEFKVSFVDVFLCVFFYDAVVCAVVLRDGYWSWESYSHCVMWTPWLWLVRTKRESWYLLSYWSNRDFYLIIGWTVSGTMQKNVKSNSLEFSSQQQQQEGVALHWCCIARKNPAHSILCNAILGRKQRFLGPKNTWIKGEKVA